MVELSQREQNIEDTIMVLKARGLIPDVKPRKPRVAWERILLSEYIRAKYPNVPSWIRREVGAIPNVPNSAAYARTRRWVDGIIRTYEGIVLIEAKMKPDPKALAQLDLYDSLFGETPEFEKYWNEPRRLELVTALPDTNVTALAPSYGIEHVVFRPSNFEEWFRVAYKIPDGEVIDPNILNR